MVRTRGERERGHRALRGAASAGVATVLAATAHTIAGGLAPLWLIVAAGLLASPIAVWLVGRAPALWRTGLVVAASQGLFHAFFAVAGSADPGAAVAHAHAGTAAQLAGSAAGHAHAVTPTMAATHLLAAAITVLVLVVGERVIGALGRGRRRIALLLAPLVPLRAPALPSPARRRRFAPAPRARSVLSLRGPPVACC